MYKVIKTTNIKNNNYFYGVIKSDAEKFDGQIGNGIDINDPMTYQFSKTKYQQAVKEFGIKSFRVEVLYSNKSAKQAYSKLREYLTPEEVASKNCYNNVYQETQPINVNVYNSDGVYLGSANTYDYDLALNGLKLGNYYMTLYLEKDKGFSKAKKMYIQNRKVYKYDLEGNFIKEYNTQVEAEQNNKYSNITKSIKLKQPCKNGFFWSLQRLPKLNWISKKWVRVYDQEGNYIRGYKFIKKCYRAVGRNVMTYFNKKTPYTDGLLYYYK